MNWLEWTQLPKENIVAIIKQGSQVLYRTKDETIEIIGTCTVDKTTSTGLFAETGHNAVTLAIGNNIPFERG